jgi:hypothetical protein
MVTLGINIFFMKLVKFRIEDGPDQVIYANSIVKFDEGVNGISTIIYLDLIEENGIELPIEMDELIRRIHSKSEIEEEQGFEVLDLRPQTITEDDMRELLENS